jgi:hypothetical protein
MKCKIYLEDYERFQNIEILDVENDRAFLRVIEEEKDYFVKELNRDDYCFFVEYIDLLTTELKILETMLTKTLISTYGKFPDAEDMSEEVKDYLRDNAEILRKKGHTGLYVFIRLFMDK